MPSEINPFGLRLPANLKTELEEAARNKGGKSLNAEIVERLAASMNYDKDVEKFMDGDPLLAIFRCAESTSKLMKAIMRLVFSDRFRLSNVESIDSAVREQIRETYQVSADTPEYWERISVLSKDERELLQEIRKLSHDQRNGLFNLISQVQYRFQKESAN
ncbi:Arc family DNA-binding protein [Pseudomonadota bacterium]